MTAPVPEDHDDPLGLTEPPADEHGSELPDEAASPQRTDAPAGRAAELGTQRENAESSADQPSDDAG